MLLFEKKLLLPSNRLITVLVYVVQMPMDNIP